MSGCKEDKPLTRGMIAALISDSCIRSGGRRTICVRDQMALLQGPYLGGTLATCNAMAVRWALLLRRYAQALGIHIQRWKSPNRGHYLDTTHRCEKWGQEGLPQAESQPAYHFAKFA